LRQSDAEPAAEVFKEVTELGLGFKTMQEVCCPARDAREVGIRPR